MQMHGGNIREISKRYSIPEDAIIDFSSNCSPLGCPASLRNLLTRAAPLLSTYPDTHASELREALARVLRCSRHTIIVGNGSTELIYLIPRAFKPRRALIVTPTFSEYERSLLAAGCAVKSLPLEEKKGYRVCIHEAIDSLGGVDMLFLCNPNNPTGRLTEPKGLLKLLGEAEKKGVLLVVDEAFMDFTPRYSLAGEVARRENLMVLRSMTKFFAIPGIRLGYLLAPPALVKQVNSCKEPWTVNVLAQKIGTACIADKPFALKTRRFVEAERARLLSRLQAMQGLRPYPSSANYLLVKITRTGLSSTALYEELARGGILIRDCSSFKGMGDKYIRVAVKRRTHNRMLLAALKKAVGCYGPTD